MHHTNIEFCEPIYSVLSYMREMGEKESRIIVNIARFRFII